MGLLELVSAHREVLHDPMGATVGSIILGSCLIVVLVLSFLHIDVWKIVLPFAGLKFLFDISWDYYRSVTRQLPKASSQEPEEDVVKHALQRATTDLTIPSSIESEGDSILIGDIPPKSRSSTYHLQTPEATNSSTTMPRMKSPSNIETSKFQTLLDNFSTKYNALAEQFPTFFTALPRLPFALIPFTISQFILVEALTHQGWIEVFDRWLAIASGGKMFPAIWIVGVMGVILCNIAGTNIGSAIFLTKVIHQAGFDGPTTRAAPISLAVASNIGAVNFTFSKSLTGLRWKSILLQNGKGVEQWEFAK